jgi:Protein of unknown function (DUF1353)
MFEERAISERFDWMGDTRPFTAADNARPAHFDLEQVDDDKFELRTSFFYHPGNGASPLEVSKVTLPDTDFASIPFYLSWFVSRHGRHTPAVLLHDRLITSETPPDARVDADLMLRDALDQCHVPPVRSRLMWAGVSLATRCTMGVFGIGGIVLWVVAALIGTYALVRGIASTNPWLVLIGVLGPFFGALFWGRQYWAGVIAGYGLWLVVSPAAASLLGYGLYWVLEQLVRVGRKLIPANRTEPLPGPPRYKAT